MSHITLPRKHDRFIIQAHLGWNYKWALCRETSWEHFGLNRKTILYSINWDLGLCDMCHALRSSPPGAACFRFALRRARPEGRGKTKAAAHPLPSAPPCHQYVCTHVPLHEEPADPARVLRSHTPGGPVWKARTEISIVKGQPKSIRKLEMPLKRKLDRF